VWRGANVSPPSNILPRLGFLIRRGARSAARLLVGPMSGGFLGSDAIIVAGGLAIISRRGCSWSPSASGSLAACWTACSCVCGAFGGPRAGTSDRCRDPLWLVLVTHPRSRLPFFLNTTRRPAAPAGRRIWLLRDSASGSFVTLLMIAPARTEYATRWPCSARSRSLSAAAEAHPSAVPLHQPLERLLGLLCRLSPPRSRYSSDGVARRGDCACAVDRSAITPRGERRRLAAAHESSFEYTWSQLAARPSDRTTLTHDWSVGSESGNCRPRVRPYGRAEGKAARDARDDLTRPRTARVRRASRRRSTA